MAAQLNEKRDWGKGDRYPTLARIGTIALAEANFNSRATLGRGNTLAPSQKVVRFLSDHEPTQPYSWVSCYHGYMYLFVTLKKDVRYCHVGE